MAIVPSVSTNQEKTTSIAHLQWTGPLDREIEKAMDTLAHHGVVGLEPTPHGGIAWALFAINAEAKFITDPDNLYWFDLILKPDPFFTKWIDLLKLQEELRLAIDIEGKTTFVLLLEKTALTEYIRLLETSLTEWAINSKPQLFTQSAQKVQNYIYETVVPQRIEIIKESTRTGESQDTLLKLVSEKAIVELPQSSELRQLAGQSRSLQNWLFAQEQRTDLLEISTIENSPERNIYLDWLYTKKILEKSTPGRYRIPHRRNNCWEWKPTTLGTLRSVWAASRNLRLLMGIEWSGLREIPDIPSPPIEAIQVSHFDYLRSNIAQSADIIKSAGIHKVYGFRNASIHVKATGCESINFRSTSPNYVQIKYVTSKSAKYNLCLFGILNTKDGSISWISPSVLKPEVAEIVNFLVAICYRDLLVCRDGMDEDIKLIQGKRGKKAKALKQDPNIQLIARIKKRGSIGEALSSTDEIKETLNKYFRVEHIRRLPPGWKASPRQLQLAQEYGFTLPPDYTFVLPSEGAQEEAKVYKSLSLINLFLRTSSP